MNREERRRLKKKNKTQGQQSTSAMSSELLVVFDRARNLFESGEFEAADELCQDISAGAPLDAEPFHLRALIQYRLGNIRKAGEMILEAITRNDDNPEIHANCGAIMNMLGRYPEAEAASRHVLELNPRRADGYSNLAVALEMQGRYDEAAEACHQALKLQPNYPEARINLGNLRVRSGDLIGAVEAYAQVIDDSPENPTAHANMSVALLRLNEPETAENYAREALAINADYPEALNALGNALVAQALFDDAIEIFDKVLLLQPGSFEAANNRAAALHKSGDSSSAITAYKDVIVDGKAPGEIFTGLGVALLSDGKISDAVQAFRDALSIKPDMADAYYNLASALGASVSEAEVEHIKSLLNDLKTPEKDQIILNFALGEIADKRGEYETAFTSFRAGNDLRKKALLANEIEFDPDGFDDEIADIISSYPKASPAHETHIGSENTAPTFIVGMPRSGTTLVEQIIAAHPNAKTLGEAATFLNADVSSAKEIEDLKKQLDLTFAGDEQMKSIVDKTPFHFLSIGLIAQVFPKARIIHCQRQADDVALSCYFQNFVSSYAWATDLTHIRRYMEAERTLMDHWKDIAKLPILVVDYEDLVDNTEDMTRRILAFLGLNWDEECLSFHKASGTSLSASNWQVRKPIYRSSLGRAQSYLPFFSFTGKSS